MTAVDYAIGKIHILQMKSFYCDTRGWDERERASTRYETGKNVNLVNFWKMVKKFKSQMWFRTIVS